jgi:malonate-semialdehyde dehydrogenase (acetylating) / methylmalonate-semialdehyde dehydrogenase
MFAFRELVNQAVQKIAESITDEHGKVLSDALGEVRGLEFARGIPSLLKGEYSDQVSTNVDMYSFREPLSGGRHHAVQFPGDGADVDVPVAIACGNTFVLKPSERDPSASMLIAELWQRAGLPDGVFNRRRPGWAITLDGRGYKVPGFRGQVLRRPDRRRGDQAGQLHPLWQRHRDPHQLR